MCPSLEVWVGGRRKGFPHCCTEVRGRGQDCCFTRYDLPAFSARKVNALPLKQSYPWGARELRSQALKRRRSKGNLPVLEPASPCAAPLVRASSARAAAGWMPSLFSAGTQGSLKFLPLSSSILECPRCWEGVVWCTTGKAPEIPA